MGDRNGPEHAYVIYDNNHDIYRICKQAKSLKEADPPNTIS